eukprot:5244175-Ditylum_brightwellii.AAC.1
MPKINKIVYAKHSENGRHHCTCVLLSINHDTKFLVDWYNHPSWGEQVVPACWIEGTGIVICQGIG